MPFYEIYFRIRAAFGGVFTLISEIISKISGNADDDNRQNVRLKPKKKKTKTSRLQNSSIREVELPP